MRSRLLLPILVSTVVGLVHCATVERRGFADDGEPTKEAPGAAASSSGTFTDGGRTGEDPPSTCTEDIDVVLVLDVSSTMNFVLQKLESEIEKVVAASNMLKEGSHFGLVIFSDNAALDGTGDLEGGKVHTAAATLKTAFARARTVYTANDRNPGDGPTGPTTQNPICEENSLDALEMAASSFPWRKNAAHVVIVATDDTFLEKPDNYGDRDGDGLTDKTTTRPREGDYPARFTVDETVAALKGNGARVFSFSRIKAASGGLLGGISTCGTGRRHTGEDVFTWGWSKPFDGKPPLPDATGGKNYDLDAVRSGKLSLADTINEVVLESHCAGPPK